MRIKRTTAMDDRYDIIIVGGGASGLVAAAMAAGQDVKVALLEKNTQCGRKILLTGKGRCNMTNFRPWEEFKEHIHPDPGFFRPAFMAFSNEDTIRFFHSLGLSTVVERGMRVFPESGRSSDVRAALERRIRQTSNVDVFCCSEVMSIKPVGEAGGFILDVLSTSDKLRVDYVRANAVILATGGLSYPATGSTGDGYRIAERLGHDIVETRPSLTALVPYNYNFSLAGLTLRNVSLSLLVDGGVVQEEFGELSFTMDGIEGALGFRVSRKAVKALDEGKKVELVIDLKPAVTAEELKKRIQMEYVPKLSLSRYLERLLPIQAVKPFMDTDRSLTVNSLPVKLKNWRFNIKSYVGYQRCVITSGGVSLKDISRKTMESKIVPGLFFAGEVMDLDADTGGYNLQIAFSTAATAIRSAMASVR